MATPVGHVLAGYVTGRVMQGRRPRPGLTVVGVAAAIAPDFDFLPGLLLGTPARFHSGISHSLGAALVVALATAAILLWWRRWPFRTTFLVVLASYASHLLLDWISADGRPPYGIPIFWPFTSEHFISPVTVLPGTRHAETASTGITEWITNILSVGNLAAIGLEVALLTPFVIGVHFLSRRNRSLARKEA